MGTSARLRHLPGVCGLDEAGRGPLAGPVFAAAVVLPKGFRCAGLNDSKQLTAAQRELMAAKIKKRAFWGVAYCDHHEVDRLNILWASMEAMKRALSQLEQPPARILVDGNKLPPGLVAEAIVDGDATFACIAAASIIAKTERDEFMRQMCRLYPEYGFSRHFGYSTPEHYAAIRDHGPCPIHRMTFAPLRKLAQPPLKD